MKKKVELQYLRSRCEELKVEKEAAEDHLRNVHLMSQDQLEKLQSLESKQDLLEADNCKMRDCLEQHQWRNLDLSHNIRNLENQVTSLQTNNKESQLRLAEKEEELTNEKRKIDHWKKEFEDVSELLNSKQVYVEKLEFEIVELQNLIMEYEEKIETLDNEHLKKKEDLKQEESLKVAEFEDKLLVAEQKMRDVSCARDEVITQNKKLMEKIETLEAEQMLMKVEFKKKIKKLNRVSKKKEFETEDSYFVKKLKFQFEESEKERKCFLKKKRDLEEEKRDLQELLKECENGKHQLERKFLSKSHENLNLSTWLRDTEDELSSVMKKFSSTVSSMTSQQTILDSQLHTIQSLESENEELKQKISDYQHDILQHNENDDAKKVEEMFKFKVVNLENNLDFEKENNKRLKTILERSRDKLYSSELECASLLKKNELLGCSNRKLQRKVTNLKTDLIEHQIREARLEERRRQSEESVILIQEENKHLMSENQVYNQRIEQLKMSLHMELDCEDEVSNEYDQEIVIDDVVSESEC